MERTDGVLKKEFKLGQIVYCFYHKLKKMPEGRKEVLTLDQAVIKNTTQNQVYFVGTLQFCELMNKKDKRLSFSIQEAANTYMEKLCNEEQKIKTKLDNNFRKQEELFKWKEQ